MPPTVLEAVAAYRGDVVSFARELIALPTENPPGCRYVECADAIERRCLALGLSAERIEEPASAAAPSLVVRLAGDGPTLWFHGHYDVVPASIDGQFDARVENGHVFGRGSADMKAGLSAMLHAIAALRDAGAPLAGDVALACVPDEETGGARGSSVLASRGILGRRGVGMITAEPTGGVVWNACRGAISLRVVVRGKAAHVGLSCRGVNAFERMLVVAEALRELEREVRNRTTRFRVEPEDAARSILLIGGRCEGGTGFNVVPDACTFTVDRRPNPEEDVASEKARLLDLLERQRASGIDLDVEVLQEGASSATPEDAPVARALAASVLEVRGRPPRFEMCPGLLETRFYARAGVPALAFGPGRLEVAHGPSECVSLEAVQECAAIYALTACRLLDPRNERRG
jgi:succinyl-diaminopimelate desuccinylase